MPNGSLVPSRPLNRLATGVGIQNTDVVSSEDWVSLVGQALWPSVVLVLGLVLRKPIAGFLGSLSGRITKVSVMSVSVELAEARPADPPWRGVDGDDVRGLVVAQQVNDSYFQTLREALGSPGSADYMIVDLRSDGDEWLTTRLYLFAYILSRLKQVRAVVFVATRGDVAVSFLAVAPVDGVMQALASAQPWLREARMVVEGNVIGRLPDPPPPPPVPLAADAAPVPLDPDDWWACVRRGTVYGDPLLVAQQFLERVQSQQAPPSTDDESEWLRLPDKPGQPPTWEHATWLRSSDLTDGLLRDAVDPRCYVVDDPSWTADERTAAVARSAGDFVALLAPSRRFDRLIDRRELLQTLGDAYVGSSK